VTEITEKKPETRRQKNAQQKELLGLISILEGIESI
jgi:hypothetical protein